MGEVDSFFLKLFTLTIIALLFISLINYSVTGSYDLPSYSPYPIMTDSNLILFFSHEMVDHDVVYDRTYSTIFSENKWSIPTRFDIDIASRPHDLTLNGNVIEIILEEATHSNIIRKSYDLDLHQLSSETLISHHEMVGKLQEVVNNYTITSLQYSYMKKMNDELHILVFIKFEDRIISNSFYFITFNMNSKSFTQVFKIADSELISSNWFTMLTQESTDDHLLFSSTSKEFLMINTSSGSYLNLIDEFNHENDDILSFKIYENQLSYLFQNSSSELFLRSVNLLTLDYNSILLPHSKRVPTIEATPRYSNSFYELTMNEDNGTIKTTVIGYNSSSFLIWLNDHNNNDNNSNNTKTKASILSSKSLNLNVSDTFELGLINRNKRPYTIHSSDGISIFWVEDMVSDSRLHEIFWIKYDYALGWSDPVQVTHTKDITDDYKEWSKGIYAPDAIMLLTVSLIVILKSKRRYH